MNTLQTYITKRLLIESLESVINNTSDIDENTIKHYYHNALSDDDKSDRMLQFLLKLHRKGSIHPTMSETIKPHMNIVSRANLKNHLSNVNSLEDLQSLTSPHIIHAKTKSERIQDDIVKELDTKNLTVFRVNSPDAAEKMAYVPENNPVKSDIPEGKAKWCVSFGGKDGEKYYKDYTENKKHPMHVIRTKDTHRDYAVIDNNRLLSNVEFRDEYDKQIHKEPNRDNPIGGLVSFLKKYPELQSHEIGKKLLTRPEMKVAMNDNLSNEELFKMNENNEKQGEFKSDLLRKIIANHPNFDYSKNIKEKPESFNMLVNMIPTHVLKNKEIVNQIVNHPEFNNLPYYDKTKTLEHGDVSDDVLRSAWSRHTPIENEFKTRDMAGAVINHPNVSQNTVDKVFNDLSNHDVLLENHQLSRFNNNDKILPKHIDSMIDTLKRRQSFSNIMMRSLYNTGKASDEKYLNVLKEGNTGIEKEVYPENIHTFPASVARTILKSPDEYFSPAVGRAVRHPKLSYDEVRHFKNTHFVISLFHREDVRQDDIDEFMNHSSHVRIDNSPVRFYQQQIIQSSLIRDRVKNEHLQKIINESDVNDLDDMAVDAALFEKDRRRIKNP